MKPRRKIRTNGPCPQSPPFAAFVCNNRLIALLYFYVQIIRFNTIFCSTKQKTIIRNKKREYAF